MTTQPLTVHVEEAWKELRELVKENEAQVLGPQSLLFVELKLLRASIDRAKGADSFTELEECLHAIRHSTARLKSLQRQRFTDNPRPQNRKLEALL